jgi:excisionase family DNA binding protein
MKSDIPQPSYLSVPEAARLCGVSRNTLYTWVRKGKLSAYQTPGHTNLIRPSDLVHFMESSGLFVPGALIDLARNDEQQGKPAQVAVKDGRPAVLVVDDDSATRSVIVRALKNEYSLFQAGTGYEALHILTGHPEIKLALLDLRMPGQHGLTTLSEIVKLRPDMRVVIITGFSAEVPARVLAEGLAARVLQKPIQLPELRETVAEVLQLVAS